MKGGTPMETEQKTECRTGIRYIPTLAAIAALLLFVAPVFAQKQISTSTSPSSSQSIQVGGRVLGTIQSGQALRYSLSVPNTATLRIRMEKVLNSAVDPKVRVLNSGGVEIGSDDDGGEGLNSNLVISLASGQYTIVAEGVGTSTGDFVLSVEEVRAKSVDLGTMYLGSLGDAEVQTRFTVNIPHQTAVRIRMMRLFGSSLDPKLTLLDASGREVATDDDGGDGLDALIRTSVSGGSYTIVAERVGTSSGRYLLSIGTDSPDRRGDLLEVGSSTSGEVRNAEFPTIGRLNITNSIADVRITVAARSSGLDPLLILTSMDDGVIASDDDGGEGTGAMIRTSLGQGEYRLIVGAYGTTSGGFDLRVDRDQIGAVSLGGSVSAQLAASASDRYRLTLQRPANVLIAADKVGDSALDPKVTLYGANGAELGSDDDSGGNNNALLLQALEAGSYTVVVSGYGVTTGDYTLSVRESVTREFGAISLGDTRTGIIDEPGERHLYRFTMSSMGVVRISLDKADGSEIDPELSILTRDGTSIVSDDDSGGGLNARILRPLNTGEYVLAVVGHGSSVGGYALSVDAQVVEFVAIGERKLGNIGSEDQVNGYTFGIMEPTSLRIRVDTIGGSGLDPIISVTDESGTVVASDDDSGGGVNALIQHNFAAGTYILTVDGYSSTLGEYVLAIDRE